MSRVIDFTAFDGVRLRGIYTEAATESLSGGFLMTHGLPSDKDEYGFYSDMSNYLSDNGYASFRFDFRGCGESQQMDFSDITVSSLINDIDAGWRELCSLIGDDNISPLSLISTSASGGAGLLWAGLTGRRVSQVFLMAPVLRYWLEAVGREPQKHGFPDLTEGEAAELATNGMLDFGEGYGAGFVHEARLVDLLRGPVSFQSPVTVVHGDRDTVVPIEGSRELAKINSNVVLLEVAGADHGFAAEGDDELTHPVTKANHYEVYRRIVDRANSAR